MRINELGAKKVFANRGIKRNKKPLQNKIYSITLVSDEKMMANYPDKIKEYEKFKKR